MNELIEKGYILYIKPINDNDSYIFSLLNNGKIVRLKAVGFQKVMSKNRQSIKIFSFCELEFFQSPKYLNFGKLKRGTLIKESKPINVSHFNQLNLIMQLLMQFKDVNSNIYKVIELIVKNIEFSINNTINILYLINILIIGENYKIKIDKCAICGFSDKISGFSLKEGGLICRKCDKEKLNDLPVETIKKLICLWKINQLGKLQLINFLSNEESLIIDMYSNFCSDILGWKIELLNYI